MRAVAAVSCAIVALLAGCSESPARDGAPRTSLTPFDPKPLESAAPSTTPSPENAVQAWQDAHIDVFNELTGSMTGLAQAMSTQNLGSVQEACAALGEDVDPLTRALPSPAADLTTALQTVADDVATAVELCGGFSVTAASAADAEKFTRLMVDAQRQFDAARRMMDAASG
jgi:hypothetical protein